jgi:hypothetical protein
MKYPLTDGYSKIWTARIIVMPATGQAACLITDILPQITGMLNKAL